jgi:pyridoxal phosphate enzyme (YggS family)
MPHQSSMPTDLSARLRQVKNTIARAEQRYKRPAESVSLLAASKGRSVDVIRAAAQYGQRLFGENYVQEAEPKISLLGDLQWHYIGPVQANKTGRIARLFEWVHSIDRLKVARRLDAQRPASSAPLNVCLQVNLSRESSKSGVLPENLPALAEQVASLASLRLRGLMALPALTVNFDQQRRAFATLRLNLEDLNRRGHRLDTLSMGMSADLEAAIAEGATIVRIGTAVFGRRN